MTTWLENLVFKLEPTKLSEIGRPILLGWKTSAAKSTGFRIQQLSTENRRYQKNTPLSLRRVSKYELSTCSGSRVIEYWENLKDFLSS